MRDRVLTWLAKNVPPARIQHSLGVEQMCVELAIHYHPKTQKGSNNRAKARKKLGRAHLKVSRKRNDWVCKLAQHVIQSNDLVAIENLKVRNMVKNHCVAKSISDAAWYRFREWLEYFGVVYGVPVIID